MIELIVAVCLVDQPSRCKNVTLNFEGNRPTMQQCGLNSQMAMAKWAGDNPNWVIQKWSCQMAGEVAKL